MSAGAPEQPLPPGAPSGLAEAMAAGSAGPLPGSPPLPPGPLSAGSPQPPQAAPVHPKPLDGSARLLAPEQKKTGRAHPMKPVTGQQIAEFAAMWNDAAYSAAQMARRYRTTERTLQDWRRDFGLQPRPEALKQAAKAQSVLGAAAAMVDGVNEAARLQGLMAAAPKEGQIIGFPPGPPDLGPMDDPEIKDLLNDLRSEARIMNAHSDLTVLQRKLSRLSILVATKAPLRSWDSLQVTMDCLSRALLRARQVEAAIPRGDADPVMLRKEAAGQLMKELQSVMTPEEQALLARLVKAGADRLMARGGGADSAVAEAAS